MLIVLRRVEITGPFECLSSGGILMDMPGYGDITEERSASSSEERGSLLN